MTSTTDFTRGAATDPAVDIKPRSRQVTDGIEATAARGMLRAVGMGDDDWEKPQIGVASSWNEITPCNLSLQRLGVAAKEGVHRANAILSPAARLMVDLATERIQALTEPVRGRPHNNTSTHGRAEAK